MRLTFRKAKRERFQQQRYEVVLDGEVVGCIQYSVQKEGSRWFWYTLGWKKHRNTVGVENSAVDLEGCKTECKQFFRLED